MRKLFPILGIIMLICMFFATFALADTQPKDPAGYYQKVNGANAGKIKYFKNGHPGDPSEWVYLGPEDPGTCDGCGKAQTFFSGNANQFSGAGFEIGNLEFDNENMYEDGNGAMGAGSETSSASYYGNGDGIGVAAAFGATGFVGGKFEYFDNGKGVGVAGLTGNIAIAGVTSEGPSCASIEGSGNLATFAAGSNNIGVAAASSDGSFAYKSSTPKGIVVGGGITGGGSVVGGGNHHVFAASGQITVSGAGSLCDGCGYEGPYDN